MYGYLVATNALVMLGVSSIVMIDGTVPGWKASEGDLHFDHHLTGEEIQLWGIPDNTKLPSDATFVTTQVDADACAAAAWLQLLQLKLDPAQQYDARAQLSAIAYDCDHLGLPINEAWNPYREFAKKAVAALKEVAKGYAEELGVPSDRASWSESDKIRYASHAFKCGTEWLVNACLGNCLFPGESGEADSYFAEMELQRPQVYADCRLYRGVAIFDQRSFKGYVDPRLAVEWARENEGSNITLTVRSGAHKPNATVLAAYGFELYSYTLGSVPLHEDGCPNFSKNGVWQALADAEDRIRDGIKLPRPETKWGGRDAVGGSSWRDPMILEPEGVIDRVLQLYGRTESVQ